MLVPEDNTPHMCGYSYECNRQSDYHGDGESILAALHGKPFNRSRPIFWEWLGTKAEPDWWPRLAVREGDWKLVLTDDTNRMELHRLSDDRAESTDLAKDYPDIVSRLAKLAFAWKATLPEKPDPECISKSNPASGNSPSKKADQAMTAPD